MSKANSSSKSSSSSSSSKSNTRNNSKPFCKVCYDAGKPEREYTSHYVKSKPGDEGKVVCPYLLSLVCTYCKKKEGHTARHCPVLLEKNKNKRDHIADDHNDNGWTCVRSISSSRHSPPPISRSRLADTPPPPPIQIIKKKAHLPAVTAVTAIKTWANIAAAVKTIETVVVATPSPTPAAIAAIQHKKEYSSDDESIEEEITREPSQVAAAPAPYRYVYGAGSSWADEE